MSGRWFRMYDELLDDPKVQRLAPETFKAWVNLLCLASRNDGNLRGAEHIAFALRMDEKKAAKVIKELQDKGLLDATRDGLEPHAWNDRQYKSDVSTDRVKQHRERKRNVSLGVTGNVTPPVAPTVPATPPDTETETETEKTPLPPPQPDPAPEPAGQARRWDHRSMDALHRRLVEAGNIGIAPVANDFNGLGPIIGVLDAGFDEELDVLPGIRRAMQDPENRPVQWKFFVGWIETARRERLKANRRGLASIAETPAAAEAPPPMTPDLLHTLVRLWAETGRWTRQDIAEPNTPGSPVTTEMIAKAKADNHARAMSMIARNEDAA